MGEKEVSAEGRMRIIGAYFLSLAYVAGGWRGFLIVLVAGILAIIIEVTLMLCKAKPNELGRATEGEK